MSAVLTNGIIIPDNGSRNWGGALANNWNIIDVNVGYVTDVKNRVTTLENSVAENSANIEINTSNISALQTSKQDTIEDLETIRAGASSGATAVQPSALNNYVDLSSEQTIEGTKTFTSRIVGSIDRSEKDLGGNVITATYATKAELANKANDDEVVKLDTQIVLAKNLTGSNITPGEVVDCEDGNGKLKQYYINSGGALMLAVYPLTGKWKSTSFITISPNDGTIFVKLK